MRTFIVQTAITTCLFGVLTWNNPGGNKDAFQAQALTSIIAALAKSIFSPLIPIKQRTYSYCLLIMTGCMGAFYALPLHVNVCISCLLALTNHTLNRPSRFPQELSVILIESNDLHNKKQD